jgi:hypothetical protein
MEKLTPAIVRLNEKCPPFGDTVLRAAVIDGDVIVVDQHGKMVNGLKSAQINSDAQSGISTITLTVRSHRD